MSERYETGHTTPTQPRDRAPKGLDRMLTEGEGTITLEQYRRREAIMEGESPQQRILGSEEAHGRRAVQRGISLT